MASRTERLPEAAGPAVPPHSPHPGSPARRPTRRTLCALALTAAAALLPVPASRAAPAQPPPRPRGALRRARYAPPPRWRSSPATPRTGSSTRPPTSSPRGPTRLAAAGGHRLHPLRHEHLHGPGVGLRRRGREALRPGRGRRRPVDAGLQGGRRRAGDAHRQAPRRVRALPEPLHRPLVIASPGGTRCPTPAEAPVRATPTGTTSAFWRSATRERQPGGDILGTTRPPAAG